MSQLNITTFKKLSRALASLFLTRDTHESMVTVLDLRDKPVAFSSVSLDTWISIVSIADKHDKIEQLLEEALHRKSGNKDLLAIKEEIEAGGYLQGDPFDIHYTPPNGNNVEAVIVYEPPLFEHVRKLRVHLSACKHILKVYDWLEAEQVNGCQIVLMMLTPELGASDRPYFSWAEKISTAGATVVPLLINACEWKSIPVFKDRYPLPKNEKFVSDNRSWPNVDTAYRQISEGVCGLVNVIRTHHLS